MKNRRDIFLNIILFLFVLFFSGIDAHANSEQQRYYLEHASGSNLENKIILHYDTSEEDQMDQSQIMFLPEKLECQKYKIYFLTPSNDLFPSVWQPPKVF
jgi:hypothetical protein